MSCKSKCNELCLLNGASTTYLEGHIPGEFVKIGQLEPAYGSDGRKTMIAQKNNTKFPAGTRHPQCLDCLVESILADNRDFILDTLKYLEK